MLLVNGTILASDEINKVLPTLEKRLCNTLQKPPLDPLLVIEACHQLAKKFEKGAYEEKLKPLIAEGHITAKQVFDAITMFKKESLLYKMKLELGRSLDHTLLQPPYHEKTNIYRKRMPLGVLFHIAAGNVEGLPAYSVVEGLLTGNINLLKLPAVDNGFTIMVLNELIQIEPTLAEYIYVFDISSNDIKAMKAMARSANAIVIWGGDSAIEAIRNYAPPNTKIIEWGHKISFAYITEKGINEDALSELAHHILNTKQLLCSSCQGIYLDTSEMSSIYTFCRRFIRTLDQIACNYPKPDIGMRAQLTLQLYTQELDATSYGKQIFRGDNSSIIAYPDQKLEVSFTHGNLWVKPLPRKQIINKLHRYKGYLQTVGLLCGQEEHAELSNLLLRAGATRITKYNDMSRMLSGETHDGEYPLQRYTKIVEYYESL